MTIRGSMYQVLELYSKYIEAERNTHSTKLILFKG